MTGPTTELRREIKDNFIPLLGEKGFHVDKRHSPGTLIFRRVVGETLHICDIQWEKYGKPRFILNLGITELKARQAADIGTWDCETYLQLKPKPGSSTGSWFRQDKPFLLKPFSSSKLYPASTVVGRLISLFTEAETFWQSGVIGPHITIVRKA